MTPIAPHISAFLQERLPREQGASPQTCATYAYAFKLLFQYASARFQVLPSQLGLEQLDAPLVRDFLDWLETNRGNSPSTRNARLVAIKSFFAFLEYSLPACLEQSRQIHAIPPKKTTVPSCGISPAPKSKRYWRRRTSLLATVCVTGPCCICATPRAFESRSW